MKTIYKVLCPNLRGVSDYFPAFPKEFGVQYKQGEFVCGRDNSKLFCFESLEAARLYIGKIQKKKWFNGTQKFAIWRGIGIGIGVAPKNTVISIKKSNMMIFANLFASFWNFRSRARTTTLSHGQYRAADKICIQELVEII